MSLTLTLDGVDISDRVLSPLTINRKERLAARAAFPFTPTAAPHLPAALIKKSVVIAWSGATIFNGKVSRAEWDMKLRRYQVEATDMLQEHFENMDNTSILAAIPGSYYSEHVFGEREDGWQYALDCMSTVPKDVHLDKDGFLQVVDWDALVTPSVSYTEAGILNGGAYSITLMEARDLITRFKFTYEYRVSRWKVRIHSFAWRFDETGVGPVDWCDWAINYGFAMPTREIVQTAAEGTGWDIVTSDAPLGIVGNDHSGIRYDGHPPDGVYCGDLINWVATEEGNAMTVIRASWDGFMSWAQTVTERYEVTMDVPSMQGAVGVMVVEEQASFQPEVDDSSFEGKYPGDVSTWNKDALDDFVQDQEQETDRVNDLNCLIGMGNTAILDSFRGNTVTIEVPLDVSAALDWTININTRDIEVQGKVQELEHIITQQNAVTRLVIAVSAGVGGVSDPLTAPARPNTDPVHAAPPNSTTLGFQIGGCSDSPNFDENIDGWSTIYPQEVPSKLGPVTRPLCSSPGDEPTDEQMHPYRFRVVGPDIEDEARNEVKATQAVTINVAVPQDTLVLS